MISPKKYYFTDLGMRNTLINGFKDFGVVAENVLYRHLCSKYRQENVFYYYENKLEVDFIVKQNQDLLACECKYTDDIEIDSNGLLGLKQLHNSKLGSQRKSVNVITKNIQKTEGGVEFVPLYKLLLG